MTDHRLDDEIYAAYAAGALSGPMRLLVDARARLDPETARARDAAERAAGLFLESLDPAPLETGALEAVLARLDAEDARAPAQGEENPRDRVADLRGLPDPVRKIAQGKGGWRFAGPGVRMIKLMREGEARAELIRVQPGRGAPRHGHTAREFTLVLRGAFHDGLGRYPAGTLCAADPSTEHRPVAEPGEACIALIVAEGPPAFTGPLGWVQRALG